MKRAIIAPCGTKSVTRMKRAIMNKGGEQIKTDKSLSVSLRPETAA